MKIIILVIKKDIMSKKRIRWIDNARAVAMFLVFFGHLGDSWFPALKPIHDAIYTFHMPLFFVLSGLFFKPAIEFVSLLAKRAKTLLIPYYFFSVLALITPAVKLLKPSLYTSAGKTADANPLQTIVSIILAQGNAGLWFLWSLFTASLALWITIKITRDNVFALSLTLTMYVVIDFVLKSIPSAAQLPFQIGKLFESTAYVGLGYLLAKLCNAYSWDHAKKVSKLLLAAASFVVFLLFFEISTNISIPNVLIQCFLSFLTTIAGITSAICFSLLIPNVRVISVIGKDSLIFYALNDVSLKLTKFLFFSILRFPVRTANLFTELILGVVTVAVAMVISYICNAFIQRHMRWCIGDLSALSIRRKGK